MSSVCIGNRPTTLFALLACNMYSSWCFNLFVTGVVLLLFEVTITETSREDRINACVGGNISWQYSGIPNGEKLRNLFVVHDTPDRMQTIVYMEEGDGLDIAGDKYYFYNSTFGIINVTLADSGSYKYGVRYNKDGRINEERVLQVKECHMSMTTLETINEDEPKSNPAANLNSEKHSNVPIIIGITVGFVILVVIIIIIGGGIYLYKKRRRTQYGLDIAPSHMERKEPIGADKPLCKAPEQHKHLDQGANAAVQECDPLLVKDEEDDVETVLKGESFRLVRFQLLKSLENTDKCSMLVLLDLSWMPGGLGLAQLKLTNDFLLSDNGNFLRLLYISRNNLTSNSIVHLMPGLEKRAESLKWLDVSCNRIGMKGVAQICKICKKMNSTISLLDLSYLKDISGDILLTVSKMLDKNRSMKVRLQGNNISYALACTFEHFNRMELGQVTFTPHPSIKKPNPFSYAAPEVESMARPNANQNTNDSSPQQKTGIMDVIHNVLTGKAEPVSISKQLTFGCHLDISGNNTPLINDDLKAINSLITNSHKEESEIAPLSYLSVGFNKILKNGIYHLEDSFKDIEYADFQSCNIGELELRNLATCIIGSHKLKRINLGNNRIDDNSAQDIEQVLDRNKQVELWLTGNNLSEQTRGSLTANYKHRICFD